MCGESLDYLPEEPKYKEIQDHKEAKIVMKRYLETVIDEVENKLNCEDEETKNIINKSNLKHIKRSKIY